jgi:SSS family solute:Na+ symporter
MPTIYGLSIVDLAVVIFFLVGTVFLGWKVSQKGEKKATDFLVGGRKLGWLLQFFLNFGNMADSNGAPTVSAEVYREGVGGSWINFQLLFTTPFYWFFPVWFRRSRQVTFADLFIDRFGDRRLATVYAVLASIIVFGIIVMGNVISYKVASAMILKPPAEWTAQEQVSVAEFHEYETLKLRHGTPEWAATDNARFSYLGGLSSRGELQSYVSYLKPVTFYVGYSLIVGSYIVLGGLKAAAIIDAFQGILIIILSFIMIPMGLHAIGGFAALHHQVDATKFQLFGSEAGNQYTLYSILAIIFTSTVASIAGVNMGPAAASAKSEHALRMGTVMGGFSKRIVTIAWLFCGLMGLALFAHGNALADPQDVWGALAQKLLMPGLMGLMISGMILGHMPAVGVACVNLSALMTRNMYAMAFPKRSDSHYLLVSKICIPLVLILSIPASLILTDFIAILSFLITFGAFMGTAGFMLYFWRRLTAPAVMIGMIVWLILMSIVPWILPTWPAFARTPALLRVGQPQKVSFFTAASAADVDAGRAKKIGDPTPVQQTLAAPSLYFDAVVRSDPANPASPLEGRGRFNVETYILSWLGVPVGTFDAADLYTSRWLFDGLFPAFMLVTLSYLPLLRLGRSREAWLAVQGENKARDDRFFVKMKTKVISDWDEDKRQLEINYAKPHSLDHLKIFPRSSWEFTRWTWDESLGFAVCWVIAFAILGLLAIVVNIGS